jgi:hypothetical protein
VGTYLTRDIAREELREVEGDVRDVATRTTGGTESPSHTLTFRLGADPVTLVYYSSHPRFDEVAAAVTAGGRMRARILPGADGRRLVHELEKDGKVVVSHAQVAAWGKRNRVYALLLAGASLCALLWSMRKWRAWHATGPAPGAAPSPTA